MTWAEFNADILTFLDTDGRRRGIEAFRTAYIKAGVADLAAYIDEYNTGETYVDASLTPFDSVTSEAVAEFLKSKIARNISQDLAMSQAHFASYVNLRRRLFLRLKEGRYPELRPFIGKPFVLNIVVKQNRQPLPLKGEVWFTVKEFRGRPDSRAFQLTRATGLDVTDEDGAKATIVMTSDDTATLRLGTDYFWDVQVEDEMHEAVIPDNLSGTMRPRQPVTLTNPA